MSTPHQDVFNAITAVELPPTSRADQTGTLPKTYVTMRADGRVPFPQIIVRDQHGQQILILKKEAVSQPNPGTCLVKVPGGQLRPGRYHLQAEGCRRVDIENARPEDWIKYFLEWEILPAENKPTAETASPPAASPTAAAGVDATATPQTPHVTIGPSGGSSRPKLYFGIHKHMHQPYYRAADPGFWDGMSDDIFATRAGPYRRFVNMAASQYQALPHAGLSMSWSGSLLEQLDRCSREGLAHGNYAGDWKAELAHAAHLRTQQGAPRADFSAFGFFHPLMPLIPPRDIVAQILRHRDFIRQEFGVEASRYLFPPETAFHVRMIPALLEAGVEGVIYDSIHRYRACREYPYAGKEEGMLPPNRAEQENPPVNDWLQLRNVWAGSKISPSLLRPEYVKYRDVDGREFKIVAIPAERYLGNEDARGGFGALVYPDVLGQVLAAIEQSGSFDPKHPPFFLLHSDGDNYGGGTDSYYGSNTGSMIEWLKNDSRFELTSIKDYLDRFPPDPASAVHIEPGSWSGADNGDPQFMKWFSRYNDPYSPDLNSWAVLTALQNAVHTMLDLNPGDLAARQAERLLLTAETSCYWYWTGQQIWDQQVTDAANAAMDLLQPHICAAPGAGKDRTGPTIFPPWITPENPGGKTWGNNCLLDAKRTGTVHTFIHDLSGLKSVRLMIRSDAGTGPEREVVLQDRGRYPTQTGAKYVANLYEAELPEGLGDVRYWIEAVDNAGNAARSALERVYLT